MSFLVMDPVDKSSESQHLIVKYLKFNSELTLFMLASDSKVHIAHTCIIARNSFNCAFLSKFFQIFLAYVFEFLNVLINGEVLKCLGSFHPSVVTSWTDQMLRQIKLSPFISYLFMSDFLWLFFASRNLIRIICLHFLFFFVSLIFQFFIFHLFCALCRLLGLLSKFCNFILLYRCQFASLFDGLTNIFLAKVSEINELISYLPNQSPLGRVFNSCPQFPCLKES